ncbi:hypothetical protein [Lentzea sp. NPDC059081]|uniref:hypothetical protein n=1 Tax=Lentzea sp. NPDC059081 TaxID=3346719 RepID=UPI003685D6F2
MTDRRTVAAGVLVLAAVTVVVGSFRTTYEMIFHGYGPDRSVATTLWVVQSDTPVTGQDDEVAYYAAGTPVVLSAALLVLAAVLLFRDKGRALALTGAGALAGIVVYYVTQVLHERTIRESWPGGGESFEYTFRAGTYLLVAGAVAGLVGAVLAQQRKPREHLEEEAAVVVHQLDADDDTPPFGIERQQEPQ